MAFPSHGGSFLASIWISMGKWPKINKMAKNHFLRSNQGWAGMTFGIREREQEWIIPFLKFRTGKMCVNWSWKILQLDHIYIIWEIGFCHDFVDCKWTFWIARPIAGPQISLNPSPIQTILFQFSTILNCEMSTQSCAIHSNPSAIWLHIGGLCPTLRHFVEGYYNLQSWSHIYFVKGVLLTSNWPYSSLFTFLQSAAIQKIMNCNWARLHKNCGIV